MRRGNFEVTRTSIFKYGNDLVNLPALDKTPIRALSIYNTSTVPVVISERSGHVVTYPPLDIQATSQGVTIKVSLSMTKRYYNFWYNAIMSETPQTSMEQNAFRELASRNEFKQNYNGMYEATADFFISQDNIARSPNYTVYITDFDLVLSYKAQHEVPPHPFSPSGIHRGLTDNAIPTLDGKVSGCHIFAVDNKGVEGERWYRMGKKIYTFTPCAIPGMEEGIYFNYSNVVRGGVKRTYQKVFSFDDDKNFPIEIFKSYEEAVTVVNELTLAETNLKKFELETKRQLAEMQREKQEAEDKRARIEREWKFQLLELEKGRELLKHEREDFEYQRKEELSKIEAERKEREAKLKEEQDRVKRYYEEREHKRKDSSDSMKWALGVLTLGVGLIALIKK